MDGQKQHRHYSTYQTCIPAQNSLLCKGMFSRYQSTLYWLADIKLTVPVDDAIF